MRRLKGPGDQVREIDGELILGREGVDVVVSDPEVSRRHAALRPVDGGVEVEDLGSSNGTFVDGQRVTDKVTVTRNATLRVGETELALEIDVPQVTRVRGAPAPDVTAPRQVHRPEVTAARPRPEPPAAPPAETPTETPAQASAAGAKVGGGPNLKRLAPFIGGGAAIAAIAGVVTLLLGGGSSKKSAGATAPRCAKHFPAVINDGFPQPKMIFSKGGSLDQTLRAGPALITVNNTSYQGMEYNNQLPGPTLVICPGDRVTVDLQNQTPLPSNLHVHGLHVSPVGDGDNVFVKINPLQKHIYHYQVPLNQSPGAFWYHPHHHPNVGPQVAAGLAGAIVVQGGLDDRLANIPQRLIVIQGGKEVPPNNLPYLPIPGAKPGSVHPPPRPGPVPLLVNGTQNPALKIRPGEIQRWRLFNATNERLLRLALPGVTFQLLAVDGNTLANMRSEKELLLGPGSRMEVLVQGAPAGNYALSALPYHACIKGCFDPYGGNPPSGRISATESLLTMVSSGAPATDQLPTGPIGNPTDLRSRTVDVRRTILFTRIPKVGSPPDFPLNQKLFDPNRVDITMKLGSVEEWTLKNPKVGPGQELHTFHLHQNAFQVVSINGHPRDYVDWEDNVNLAAGDTVVIRINPIDFTGKFVFHCHLIPHEDHGMMGVVQVEANPTASVVNANRFVILRPHQEDHQLYADRRLGGSSARAFRLYCRRLLRSSQLA
jgi:FtsP/CotA-like multicopper oxidase with cupredoxin domain